MSRHAIYAGSFDPPTLGHLDIIQRAAILFDRLTVAVGVNPGKKLGFPADQRCALIRELIPTATVQVVPFQGLLVDAAQSLGANVILRGIRGPQDLELELRNGIANRELSGIESLFLISDPRYAHVSSSLVKEIFNGGGDVRRYLPISVHTALVEWKARSAS